MTAELNKGESLSGQENEEAFEFNLEQFLRWIKSDIGADLGSAFIADDWTTVIKLHATIETALNSTLVKHLGEPSLSKIISKLETSNVSTGKVAFARALGILPKAVCVFIQKLSELRNHCVHDIRNFNFDLDKYIERLDEGERKAFINSLKAMLNNRGKLLVPPKAALCLATFFILVMLHGHQFGVRAPIKS